jgi:hypothetical protein
LIVFQLWNKLLVVQKKNLVDRDRIVFIIIIDSKLIIKQDIKSIDRHDVDTVYFALVKYYEDLL